MSKKPICCQVSYVNDSDEGITARYNSLYEVNRHYNVSVASLKKMIVNPEGKFQKKLMERLPKEFKIEQCEASDEPKVEKQKKKRMWKCDVCDKEYCLTSKISHLRSAFHQKRVGESIERPDNPGQSEFDLVANSPIQLSLKEAKEVMKPKRVLKPKKKVE